MITGSVETVKRARKLRSEMTLPEGILWKAMRQRPNGLKFRRQHPAGVYILDFHCSAAKLAIEVDGRGHDGVQAAKADAARSHFLRSQGIATVRVPAQAVLEDAHYAMNRIVEVCLSRIAR